MKKSIRRIKDTKNLLIQKDGGVLKLPMKEIFNNYKVHGAIRFRRKEFLLLKKHQVLTHFNLQSTNHKKGKRYLLALIVKPGFFNGKKEQPPIISLENALVGVCIGARNHVPYEKLRARDFKYSFENIKIVDQLKKAILKRYCQSMPLLSKKKILSLGVGITRLRILSAQKNKGSNEAI
jgi:hypothetical protein